MACRPSLSGKMKHRITIQVSTHTTGATGEPVDGWADHITARASVEPLVGREYFQAYQEQSENKVKFRMRYSSALAAVNTRDHRISFNSNTYDIESVINPFHQNKEILIMAVLHNE